jgi:hypothetical protein
MNNDVASNGLYLNSPDQHINFGIFPIFCIFAADSRDVSSVGLEHRLDRAGVTGSNPVHPTPTF